MTLALLEEFAPAPAAAGSPQAAWREGHAAGLAEGRAAARTADAAALSALVGALDRVAAEVGALRAARAEGIGAALRATVERLCPALADAAFSATVAAQVEAALERAPGGLSVIVSEEGAALLAAACPDWEARGIALDADDALAPHAARIRWRDGGAEIDLDAAAEAILALARDLAPTEDPEERA